MPYMDGMGHGGLANRTSQSRFRPKRDPGESRS